MNRTKISYAILLAVIFSLLFISCNEKEILPEEKFIQIYVDILIAEDTTSVNSVPRDSLRTIVLKKHNTTDIVYKNTIDFYNESAERWENFFDKAVVYVEELKTKSEE